MNKITAWDYSCVSREHYLNFLKEEKEVMFCKYYTDITARSSGKNFICNPAAVVRILFAFLSGLICWKIYLYEEVI